MKRLFMLVTVIFFLKHSFAQAGKDSSVKEDNTFQQMLDYSRPGKFHQLLENVVGSWKFEGDRYEWTDSVTSKPVMKLAGTVKRKSFADGRFFIAELTTSEKIALPAKNSGIITDHARGIQTEGYDNVHNKFQISYINSHIGSDIAFWEGQYDSTTKTISFLSSFENVPGMKLHFRFDFVFIDNNHYQWNYYIEQNAKYLKESTLNFTRVK